jgi:hypothetical protein
MAVRLWLELLHIAAELIILLPLSLQEEHLFVFTSFFYDALYGRDGATDFGDYIYIYMTHFKNGRRQNPKESFAYSNERQSVIKMGATDRKSAMQKVKTI